MSFSSSPVFGFGSDADTLVMDGAFVGMPSLPSFSVDPHLDSEPTRGVLATSAIGSSVSPVQKKPVAEFPRALMEPQR
jgi:hypothetical protein